MKNSVYLDTTIPSYYFEERKSVQFQVDIMREWFQKESNNYRIYLSSATIFELQQGNYP